MADNALRKWIVLLMCILIALSENTYAQHDTLLTEPVLCNFSDWNLVFSDEFEGNSLDGSKWITWFPYTNDGSDKCTRCCR